MREKQLQNFWGFIRNLYEAVLIYHAGRESTHILTLLLPGYHCRQWKSCHIYASPVAKGLNNSDFTLLLLSILVLGNLRIT